MVTRQSDGEKPTYEQLEEAYVMERTKREVIEKVLQRCNEEKAMMRYQLKKIQWGDE